MLEPIVVDAPTFYPYGCASCGSAKGPLVDTSRELAGGLRVYQCASCVRLAGIKLGLLDGDESEKRRGAAERLTILEGQHAKATERVRAQDKQLKQAAADLEQAQAEAAQAHGRVAQLEEAIAARATAELAMVEG